MRTKSDGDVYFGEHKIGRYLVRPEPLDEILISCAQGVNVEFLLEMAYHSPETGFRFVKDVDQENPS